MAALPDAGTAGVRFSATPGGRR